MEFMPMERPTRGARLAVAGWLALLAASGCRSPQSEVPPGKPYQTVGHPPAVGFSSDPHPATASGMAGLYGNRGPGDTVSDGAGSARQGDLLLGTPTSPTVSLGAPSDHRYGSPGTSGGAGSPTLGDSLLKTVPPAADLVKQDPNTAPASGSAAGGP
jgi:hypothetical protein